MLRILREVATAVALFSILVASSPADASVVLALDLEELTVEADRIVVGKVVWAEPIRNGNGMIRTRHRIQVTQDLRGSGDSEIIVETLGGRIALRTEGWMTPSERAWMARVTAAMCTELPCLNTNNASTRKTIAMIEPMRTITTTMARRGVLVHGPRQ